MRVLGIDVGLKRTGLAVSDERGISVRFLPNLQATSQQQAMDKILALCKELTVKVIVIGIPEAKTTGSIAIASRALSLKKKLEEVIVIEALAVDVVLWDEEMTSKKALQHMVDLEVPQKKRKTMLDAASAAVLVQEYLSAQG